MFVRRRQKNRQQKKTIGSVSTFYFYGPSTIISEFSTDTSISNATAATTNDKTAFAAADRQGTAVLLIAASGLILENNRTLPYGELWCPQVSSQTTEKMQQYERDTESGLDYAMNRYVAGSYGRFMSSDKGGFSPKRPMTLNRYAYVTNDPVNLSDPDGNDDNGDDSGPYPYLNDPGIAGNGNCIDGREALDERCGQEPAGGGGGQTKADIKFNAKVTKARNTAQGKLAKASADCANLFADLGLAVASVSDKLSHMTFMNGVTSTAQISLVLNQQYANATGTNGWTVANLFANGFPGQPGLQLNGWSPPGTMTAYLRPNSTNWDTLIHETLHQFGDGFDDTSIMQTWQKNGINIDPNGPSDQISKEIKKDCNK